MRLLAALFALALVLPVEALAQASGNVVKLATLVPDGSVWDKALKSMGADWSTVTQGRVTLRIYPGGVTGDEPDVVRKMRIGQIHAAALTLTGLTEIDESFRVFGIPMFFSSYPELFQVIDRMEPELKKRLEAKGFVLLNWGHGGWVHFFTRTPVRTVDELKKLKIFVWAGDDIAVQMWKAQGFNPVALAATDILPALQTGMIDALPSPPLAANLLAVVSQGALHGRHRTRPARRRVGDHQVGVEQDLARGSHRDPHRLREDRGPSRARDSRARLGLGGGDEQARPHGRAHRPRRSQGLALRRRVVRRPAA
jgi:hypothetical protein